MKANAENEAAASLKGLEVGDDGAVGGEGGEAGGGEELGAGGREAVKDEGWRLGWGWGWGWGWRWGWGWGWGWRWRWGWGWQDEVEGGGEVGAPGEAGGRDDAEGHDDAGREGRGGAVGELGHGPEKSKGRAGSDFESLGERCVIGDTLARAHGLSRSKEAGRGCRS